MRILLLVFNLTGKGTYWRAFHFGRGLAQRGHQVTLVSTSPGERLHLRERPIEGLTLLEAPDLLPGALRSGWDPWNTFRRIQRLRLEHFDLVHAFECRPTVLYPALEAQKSGAALLFDWADWFGRGGSVEERTNPLVRAALRPVETYFEEHFRARASGNTVICSTLKDKAQALGIPDDRLLLVPNGCSPDRFPLVEPRAARQAAGLSQEAFLVGYIGTIFKRDAKLMAQAFDRVVDHIPHARLIVIGYCPFDIRSLSNHPEAILQTGPLEEEALIRYLLACDLFWLPLCDTNANRGRWPLKLNDYLSAGRPVIATAVGDVAALIQREPVGLLSPDLPEPFARQTLSLYADLEQRGTMGRLARFLAETIFSWDHLTDQLEAFYLRIISTHQNSPP